MPNIITSFDEQIAPARAAYQQFKRTVADISDEQTRWKNVTRPNLLTLLENIIQIELKQQGWDVKLDQRITGRESVSLIMTDQQSGLTRPGDLNVTRHNLKGGRLVFSQLTNGSVSVAVEYPLVMDVEDVKPTNPRQLGPFHTIDLTDERIISLVAAFFETMTDYVKKGQ